MTVMKLQAVVIIFVQIVLCFYEGSKAEEEPAGCLVDHHHLLKLIEKEQASREKLEIQINELRTESNGIKGQLNDLIDSTSRAQRQFAFSGRLQENIAGPQSNRTIIFKGVVTNIGNAYSLNTGIFHCPVDGLYLFSASLISSKGDWAMLPFYQNEKQIFRPHTSIAASVSAATDSAVVHAKAGDEIYPKNLAGSLDWMSTFTAVLLQPDA